MAAVFPFRKLNKQVSLFPNISERGLDASELGNWCYSCSQNSVCSAWLAPPGTDDSQYLRCCGHKVHPCGTETVPAPPRQCKMHWVKGKERLRGVLGKGLNGASGRHHLPVLINAKIQKASLRRGKCEDYMHWKGRKRNVKTPHPFQNKTKQNKTNGLLCATDQSPFPRDVHHNIWPAWCYFWLCFLLLFTQLNFFALTTSLCQLLNDLETSNS